MTHYCDCKKPHVKNELVENQEDKTISILIHCTGCGNNISVSFQDKKHAIEVMEVLNPDMELRQIQ